MDGFDEVLSISADDFDEIISAMVDNGYCPCGKMTDGCPYSDEGGNPVPCEECWKLWFESMGVE